MSQRVFVIVLLIGLSCVVGAVADQPGDKPRPALDVDRVGGTATIWVETQDSDGESRRSLLRKTDAEVTARASGGEPSGRAKFATWDEAGQRWFAYSRDGGATWVRARELRTDLRLLDGAITPDAAMPAVPVEFSAPASGRLFLVQFRTIGIPEWREALAQAGAEVLQHVPYNAHIVRIDGARAEAIRSLEFVERVEPYHPWYRVEPELRSTAVETGLSGGAQERVRVSTFEWGPEAKQRIITAAEAIGARVAGYWPSGSVVELWASPDQVRLLAAHDDVRWIDRWSEPEPDMDLVRQDAGTDFVENTRGYCGQGVRGEVMDLGIQDDHPDFDGVLIHGAHTLDSHGTATYGIVFGNGDRDGDGEAKGTGHLACAEQGIFADNGEFSDRFAHTQELKSAPYHASFQTNSWGSSTTQIYNSYSEEMDDIIWRLDIAITQSQSNTGNRSSRPQAWAKNVISVGGVRHYDTLETSDDAWASGASIGPAQDGRIKPDVSYWYDYIYTTTTGSGYTPSFGGTSAATPETAGVVGLIVQMWADNVWETDPVGATAFEKQPHASTIKALLINNAQQYAFTGETHDLTRVHQGWGRPSAQVALERASNSLVIDEEVTLELDDLVTYDIAVIPGESELKVTMIYPDPPGTTASTLHRINDVNLKVTSPSATVYHGNVGLEVGVESTPGGSPNGIDTVENVFVRNPQSGIWQVEIEAVEINQDGYLDTPADDVTFALVVTGGTAPYTSGEGQVRFMRDRGECGATYPIRVRDGNVGSSVSVTVWSDSETTPESVVLTETVSGSGIYTGEIPTSATPTSTGDGVLTAADGDLLTVRYVDADDGGGGSDVAREATAVADCVGPSISAVGVSGIADTAANITWTTDEGASSWVHWDTAAPLGNTETRAGNRTTHVVRLSQLQQCTRYEFAVGGADPVGNSTEDDNGGANYSFVTYRNTAGELHDCRSGRIVLAQDVVGCAGTISVLVSDLDLNVDPGVIETVDVQMSSSTETVPEIVTLNEVAVNSGVFYAVVPIAPGPAVSGDGQVQVEHGDLITGRYDDADDGTGSPAVSIDTALANCEGARIYGVAVTSITDSSAQASWSTSDVTTGQVEWGITPALGSVATSTTLKTDHSVTLSPFGDCDRIYFRVVATDSYDNVTVSDVQGMPYEFNAYTVPGTIFRDDFAGDLGWSLEGEWEIAAPQGLGTYPGDPAMAYTGARVLGHDLTGLGATPGDYEAQTTESATSPSIDASGLTSAEIRFQRRLNVANGAKGYLEAKDSGGTWHEVWASPNFGGLSQSSWSSQSYDVSAWADGNSNLKVRFRQESLIANSNDAGWNVDHLIVRDGSLPETGACGNCEGAPTFAGVISALDDEPCVDSTITLRWDRAPAWGSGSTGTYAIYRDTVSGFTPGPGNLLASGVGVPTWTDSSPPADVTLYYLVKAENDETCGTGPNNNGLVDPNSVYLAARNDTSQSAPGDVGDSLVVDPYGVDARLGWSVTPGAAAYRVYRSSTPDSGFTMQAEPVDPFYDDPGVMLDGQSWFYLIHAIDACGNEGP